MEKLLKIMAVTAIFIHLLFYTIYGFKLKLSGEALNVFYAFGFHIFVLFAAIIFYFKFKNNIVRVFFIYTIVFEFVCIVAFVVLGLYYDKPYFFYKEALISSIPLAGAYYLTCWIYKKIKYARSHIV